jgi:hypothetical protein
VVKRGVGNVMRRGLLSLCALAALTTASPATPAAAPVHVSVFVHTGLPLGEVQWTGTEFLYDSENLGTIEVSDARGRTFTHFATFDQGGEEMRCRRPLSRYWRDGIYCHTPDNRVVRFDLDGSHMTEVARVPSATNSDGALTFDTSGRFGYALLAATGGSASNGGQLFLVRTSGKVTLVGSYPGPGGAENIAIAPPRFGAVSGWVLVSIDQDRGIGRLVAVDPRGRVRSLASFPKGINPIAVIEAPPAKRAAGSPAAGLYVADTTSQNVFFASAASLQPYVGGVVVGTEVTGDFWVVRPKASGRFEAVPLATDLSRVTYNLEAATYVR